MYVAVPSSPKHLVSKCVNNPLRGDCHGPSRSQGLPSSSLIASRVLQAFKSQRWEVQIPLPCISSVASGQRIPTSWALYFSINNNEASFCVPTRWLWELDEVVCRSIPNNAWHSHSSWLVKVSESLPLSLDSSFVISLAAFLFLNSLSSFSFLPCQT